ncbi:MAG: YqiA/YcfP family alpha/beta fold hydrolase [Spirochaetales bacterium]|nr:YqiA/YcfP family alpha/beta fold hydrolase [Spirochaetales bacterium]
MTNILYVHGFNGNPKGGTYEGLVDFFKDKEDYNVISFPFPKLHSSVEETQKYIEELVDQHDIKILIGASLGGFYTLCCKKPVKKIAINPCMIPSVEITLLKDRDSGKPIHIEESVIAKWKELEKYELDDSFKDASGIFGLQDATFHYDENHNYSPLFRQLFSDSIAMVEGVHSLENHQLAEGLSKVL